ncbi:hypothetical protein HDU76_000370 [Blyttiomyces sp. JEL0837]|nr:hypothetical protein HDU76_000370 [Blyttiomyces sp. JEL0837]
MQKPGSSTIKSLATSGGARHSGTITTSSGNSIATTSVNIIFNFTTTSRTTTIFATFPSTRTDDVIVTRTTNSNGIVIINTVKTGSTSSVTGPVTSWPPTSQKDDTSTSVRVSLTPTVLAVSIFASSLIAVLIFVGGVCVGKNSLGKKSGGGGHNEVYSSMETATEEEEIAAVVQHDDENPVIPNAAENETSALPTVPQLNALNPESQHGRRSRHFDHLNNAVAPT